MLRIRFSRVGKKNAPSFRLVLTPKQSPPKGKFLEILGFYNPRTKEKGLEKERILHWIKEGAQPSDTAHNFLVREGVIEGEKLSVHSTKKRKKTSEEATEKKDDATTEEKPAEATEEKPVETEAPVEKPTSEEPKEEKTEEAPKEEKVDKE